MLEETQGRCRTIQFLQQPGRIVASRVSHGLRIQGHVLPAEVGHEAVVGVSTGKGSVPTGELAGGNEIGGVLKEGGVQQIDGSLVGGKLGPIVEGSTKGDAGASTRGGQGSP